MKEGEEAFDYEIGEEGHNEQQMQEHEDEEEDVPEPAVLTALGLSQSGLDMAADCDLVEEDVPITSAPSIKPVPGNLTSPPDSLCCNSWGDQPNPDAGEPARSSKDAAPQASSTARGSTDAAPQTISTTDTSAAEVVAPSPGQAKDLQQIAALRCSLDALQAAGGDPTAEGMLSRRLNTLQLKIQCAAMPGAKYVRARAKERDAKEREGLATAGVILPFRIRHPIALLVLVPL